MIIFLLSVISIPVLSYFVLQINGVQNFIAHRIKNRLEPFLGIEIYFDKVSIDMLNRVVVDNLIVLDQKKDTIVKAYSAVFGLDYINFSNRKLKIEKLELNHAQIYFFIDSARSLNLEHIVNKALAGSDSTKPGWLVEFDHIGIVDSKLRINDALKEMYSGRGVNFDDINFNGLNIRVRDLTVWDGLCTFKINKLSFTEQSGFDLKQLSGRMSIQKNMMHFNNLSITTANSSILAPRIYFDFNRFGNFSDFSTKVNLQFWIKESDVSLTDISYFMESAYGMTQRFSLSGKAKGKFSNLLGSELNFQTGTSTNFSGDLLIKGLPDVKHANIDMETENLNISARDVESIYLPFLEEKYIKLPDIVRNIGKLTFQGNFKGFPDNFITYGTFQTNIGTFITDVSLKPQSRDKIGVNGKISANNFNAGKIFKQENLFGNGNFSMNADIVIENGNKLTGTFNSDISDCFINSYQYKSIRVSGSLKENAFDGIVKVDDPNLSLSAAGYFDFSKANTTFNFSSTVYNANPFVLNLVRDSITYVSGQMIANLKGRNIDSIDGEIGLANILIKRNLQPLSIKNIYIKSDNSGILKSIQLRSDLVQASIMGEHDLGALKASFINFIRNYLPETIKRLATPIETDNNRFTFEVLFKNTRDICDFLSPGSKIASNTSIKGYYAPEDKKILLELKSDSIKYSAFNFKNLHITGSSNPDSLWLTINSGQSLIGDQISMLNTSTKLLTFNDSAFIQSHWKDSLGHESNLNFLSGVKRLENMRPVVIFEVLPSTLYLLNEAWTLNESTMVVDSSSILIPQFSMLNKNQQLNASGSISESKDDVFSAEFSNFNLNIVNFLLNMPKLKLDGNLSGKLSITDFYNSRQLFANVSVKDFKVNQELLGNTSLNIKLDKLSERMNVKARTETGNNHFVNLSGDYIPEGEKLDFVFTVNEIGAQIFEPFIESIFGINSGKLTGYGNLTGNLNRPVLNAQLDADSISFLIKPLKTNYSFNSKLRIIDNKFLLKNIKLRDSDDNICKVDGYIDNQYFKTFQLYINLMLDKNLVLNLRPKDQMPFYGKGYASGIVRITGNPDQVNIDIISAKTEKNSTIFIPLNQNDIVAQDFITFSQKKEEKVQVEKEKKQEYKVKASGLILNIDLEVTPEAEVQLIFDPALGDIMRAQGAGNLKLELDKFGNFTIRGNYTVKSGDYLFTFKNLLNKQFIIDQGGSIVFNGSPLDATLDVTALYKTRTSLYNLFYSDDFKKRIPVNCQLFITGKLLNPDIRYDINLPNAADETKNKVKEAINNESELSKQFMSLLVLNNFLYDPAKQASLGAPSSNVSVIGRDAAATTSLELLSSQVSNWMSQISKDFELGVNYRPGDKNITNQEFEVALSTQLLDDRVSINGNLDFIGNQATTATNQNKSNLVGDVNVEFKLTDKVMLKAFNRSNELLFDYNDLYTRGLGIAYREEFSNFSDLRQRYYQMLFAPKKDSLRVDSVIAK